MANSGWRLECTIHGLTPCAYAQLAFAWVLAQGDDIVPIPGTKRVRYLEDNLGALDVTLTEEDEKHIREQLAAIPVTGERYQPAMMELLDHA